MEAVASTAVGLAAIRTTCDTLGVWIALDGWRGVSLFLLGPFLVGLAGAQGPALWWEGVRHAGPDRWGRGRWVWAFAGTAAWLTIAQRAVIVTARAMQRDSPRLLQVQTFDLLVRMPEVIGPGVFFVLVAGRRADRRRPTGRADLRECSGRIFGIVVVAWFASEAVRRSIVRS